MTLHCENGNTLLGDKSITACFPPVGLRPCSPSQPWLPLLIRFHEIEQSRLEQHPDLGIDRQAGLQGNKQDPQYGHHLPLATTAVCCVGPSPSGGTGLFCYMFSAYGNGTWGSTNHAFQVPGSSFPDPM
jgi:hypothetical protein